MLTKRILAIAFFTFICWVIYIADTNDSHALIKLSERIPYGDKVNHFFLFGLLTFLINISFNHLRIWSLRGGTVLVSIFCVIEEFSQIGFATRNFDLVDLLFDALGITFFTYLSRKWPAISYYIEIQKRAAKVFLKNLLKKEKHSF